jgi:hypothetical protein
MKNARIVALMFVAFTAMSAASAQEVSKKALQDSAAIVRASQAAAASGPAEQQQPAAPTAVEAGAKKVGSFFGKLVKGPVQVGKALASGVREGFSQPSPAPQDQGGSATSQSGAMTSASSSMTAPAATPQEMARRITTMFDRVKGMAPAPVEDRSVSASSSGHSSSSSASSSASNRLSRDQKVAVVTNQVF